ncbi:hypothetical protein [Streptomyces vietnamensis]|uniref:hypothetical protein n=1 Tax=Streptomyces vietnamensis TaxID=362257 RepID=UPI00341D7BDE
MKKGPSLFRVGDGHRVDGELHRDTCVVDDPLSPSATVAVARVRGDAFEWLVLGDCTVLVDSNGVVTATTDDRLAQVAPRAREALT